MSHLIVLKVNKLRKLASQAAKIEKNSEFYFPSGFFELELISI